MFQYVSYTITEMKQCSHLEHNTLKNNKRFELSLLFTTLKSIAYDFALLGSYVYYEYNISYEYMKPPFLFLIPQVVCVVGGEVGT